jgi:hypothetical protein
MNLKPETLDLLDLLWLNFIILTFSALLFVGIAIIMTKIEILELTKEANLNNELFRKGKL